MIGDAYQSVFAQAVLGPSRSLLIPEVLYLGWFDVDGELIAMSGTTVSHDVWDASDGGVVNNTTVDGGVAGDGWEIHGWGLFDAASDGDLLIGGDLSVAVTPDEGDPLSFDPGTLTVSVTA